MPLTSHLTSVTGLSAWMADLAAFSFRQWFMDLRRYRWRQFRKFAVDGGEFVRNLSFVYTNCSHIRQTVFISHTFYNGNRREPPFGSDIPIAVAIFCNQVYLVQYVQHILKPHLPLKNSNCSTTVMCSPGQYTFRKIFVKGFQISRTAANVSSAFGSVLICLLPKHKQRNHRRSQAVAFPQKKFIISRHVML